MSSSGQSVTDRLNAAKHSLTGQGLAKAVCKSTTEEVSGPKRKHLDYLLQCTHETNVSVPQMADLLIQRTQTANWVVVFKSLITVHNVMNYGSERYMQYMASNTVFSNLDSFNDRSTPQGYDMSTYIRKYAKYINEKAVAYRLMAFDFCKVKRGKEDGLLRTMAPEKLLKALPVLQAQIDALLEFDPSLNELNNGVINAAFLLLFKDLIRLFACYNDGIINLLEKFFEMNRKQCKEALDIYKKFLVRMDQTGEFLKVAEPWSKKQNVGIDKGDIPDLTKAPASLLEALEAHLKSLEGKKASKLQASAQKAGGTGLSEEEKKKILAEEEKELQRMKSPGGKPEKAKKKKKRERKEKAQSHSAQMESASQVPAQQTTQVIAPQPAATAAAPAPSASDDLLALDVSPFQAKANNVMSVANSSNQQWAQNPLDPMSLSPAPAQPTPGAFTSETGFASAFGTTQQSPMPGMFLQPSTAPLAPTVSNHQESKGQLLMPQKKEDQTPADSKLVKKDLESSLASLTESKLVMTPGSMNKGNHQWGPEQPKKMTGGQNFQQVGQPAAAGAATTWMTQQQPVNPLMGQPPAGFNMQPSQQFFVNPAAPQLYPANFAANPYATNMAPPMYQPRPQQPMMPQQQQMMQPMQPQSTNNPDLFGL